MDNFLIGSIWLLIIIGAFIMHPILGIIVLLASVYIIIQQLKA